MRKITETLVRIGILLKSPACQILSQQPKALKLETNPSASVRYGANALASASPLALTAVFRISAALSRVARVVFTGAQKMTMLRPTGACLISGFGVTA